MVCTLYPAITVGKLRSNRQIRWSGLLIVYPGDLASEHLNAALPRGPGCVAVGCKRGEQLPARCGQTRHRVRAAVAGGQGDLSPAAPRTGPRLHGLPPDRWVKYPGVGGAATRR